MPTRPRHARKHKNTSSASLVPPGAIEPSLSAGSSASGTPSSAASRSEAASTAGTPLSLSPYPVRRMVALPEPEPEPEPEQEKEEAIVHAEERVKEEDGLTVWDAEDRVVLEGLEEKVMDDEEGEEGYATTNARTTTTMTNAAMPHLPPPRLDLGLDVDVGWGEDDDVPRTLAVPASASAVPVPSPVRELAPVPVVERGDVEEDVLAQLIDFGSPLPSGPALLPVEDAGDDVKEYGVEVREYEPKAYEVGVKEYEEPVYHESRDFRREEEEGEQVFKSPPFMQVALPDVGEAAPVVAQDVRNEESREGLGLGMAKPTWREGHVRMPVVVSRSTSTASASTSSNTHTHSRSSSLNPPSLTLDLSSSSSLASQSTAASTFGSLSKTIRAFGLTSPRKASPSPALPSPMGASGVGERGVGTQKGAPYPPLVSRPLVKGRVESPVVKAEGEEDGEGGYNNTYGYGYGYAAPSKVEYQPQPTPAPVRTVRSVLGPQTPTPRSSTSSTPSTSRPTSRVGLVPSAPTMTVPVPERQRAWPEYASPFLGSASVARSGAGTPVSAVGRSVTGTPANRSATSTPGMGQRHRATRSLGGQAAFGGGVSGLTQTMRGGVDHAQAYGSAEGDQDEVERVVWARWDMFEFGGMKERRQVLVVGYAKSVQVWDVRDLGAVGEVLNLDFERGLGDIGGDEQAEEVSAVVKAVVVPGSGVLAVLLETAGRNGEVGTTLVMYGMKEDRVVGRWSTEGVPVDVQCSRGVVGVSTSSPAALHILSSTPALNHLHTIPASSLALFSTPLPPSSSSQLSLAMPSSVSPSTGFGFSTTSQQQYSTGAASNYRRADRLEEDGRESMSAAHRAELPHPVYALHGRLLAYAIPSTSASSTLRRKESSLSSSSGGSGPSPSSITSGASPLLGGGLSAIGQGLGLGTGVGGIPNTKAELGSAALKVGSGLIGGMRFLGGMALEGVKSRMNAGSSSSPVVGPGPGTASGNTNTGGGGLFSKSAPTRDSVGTAMGSEEEKKRRRFSDIQQHGLLAPLTAKRGGGSQGYLIRVVDVSELALSDQKAGKALEATVRLGERDLGAMVRGGGSNLDATVEDAGATEERGGKEGRRLRVVAEFVGSRSQSVAKLEFTPDGCGVYVVPSNGYITKVFRVLPVASSHPAPPTTSSVGYPSPSPQLAAPGSDIKTGSAVPLYQLRRGRVSTAVVESVKGVPDGRWTGVVTRNRTVHVFATNPLGGRPHILSHLDGRMRNGAPVVPPVLPPAGHPVKTMDLQPVVRLPGEKLVLGDGGWSAENPPPAMAFTFVDASTTMPFSLAPSPLVHHHRGSASNASTSMASSPPAGLSLSVSPGSPLSPRPAKAPKNYQDALLFDSATGILYLQRISLESRLKSDFALGAIGGGLGGATVGGLVNAAINVSSSLGSRSVSASLPGGGGPLGMTGTPSVPSSSVSSHSGVGQRGTQRGQEEGHEIVGKANVVATWDLRKRRGWDEVRGKIGPGEREVRRGVGKEIMGPDECLAQAELSTFSKTRSTRSRPIYLTHQFVFHTLGEDYHALIRKYRLDVHGSKIDVRREIPIHAFGTTAQGVPSSESFVEGFSPTRSNHPGHLGGGVPSSFDEPLASALAGEMEYTPSSNVLPMYPNGPGGGTGGSGRSFRNSIPIRKFGDGVTGGLGRIRRAVPTSVRSPKLGPSRSGGSGMDDLGGVLLEFDEEVDDFMAPRIVSGGTGGGGSIDDDVVGTVDEEIWGDSGWDNQDRLAVEEEEQFHAISGTLSPQFEQELMLPTSTATPLAKATSSRKPKKGRK